MYLHSQGHVLLQLSMYRLRISSLFLSRGSFRDRWFTSLVRMVPAPSGAARAFRRRHSRTFHRLNLPTWSQCYKQFLCPENTKGGSITVPLTSCLTGSESAVWQLTIFVFICKTGGQWYSDTSPFSIPCFVTSHSQPTLIFVDLTSIRIWHCKTLHLSWLWSWPNLQILFPIDKHSSLLWCNITDNGELDN